MEEKVLNITHKQRTMIYYSQNLLMFTKAQIWRVSFSSLLIFGLSKTLTRFDAQAVEISTNDLRSNTYTVQLSQSLPLSPPIPVVPPIPVLRNPFQLTLNSLLPQQQPRPIPIPQSLPERLVFDEFQERRRQQDLLLQVSLLVDGQLRRAWSSIPRSSFISSEPLLQNSQFQVLLATFDDLKQQYQQINDPYGELKVLEGLAFLYYAQQKPEEAMTTVQAAVSLAQSIDLVSQKEWLSILSAMHLILGNDSMAIEAQKRAVDISKEIAESVELMDVRMFDTAWDLMVLGDKYTRAGNNIQAIEAYEQSWQYSSEPRSAGYYLDTYSSSQRFLREAVINRIIKLYTKLGQPQQVEQWVQRLTEANQAYNLSIQASDILYRSDPSVTLTVEMLEQALSLYRQAGDHYGEIDALSMLSSAYIGAGNQERAVETAQKALELSIRFKSLSKLELALERLNDACCSSLMQQASVQLVKAEARHVQNQLYISLHSRRRFHYNSLKLTGLVSFSQ